MLPLFICLCTPRASPPPHRSAYMASAASRNSETVLTLPLADFTPCSSMNNRVSAMGQARTRKIEGACSETVTLFPATSAGHRAVRPVWCYFWFTKKKRKSKMELKASINGNAQTSGWRRSAVEELRWPSPTQINISSWSLLCVWECCHVETGSLQHICNTANM